MIFILTNITVFDVVQSPPLSSPPCKFGKILVVDNFVEKIILKILELEITSKKIFIYFSFHYVRYCNHLVTFLGKNYHQFAFFQALNEVSQSNIFLVFFCYIWSSRFNRIFIIIRICFLISKLNINWFLLFFIVFLQIIVIIFYLNFGNWSSSCRNFYRIYKTLCVFTALLLQDQTIQMRFPLSKLIHELLLIYS